MNLLDRLYLQTPVKINETWEKFALFHPDLRHLSHRPVKEAITGGDKNFFVRQLRNNYLPLPLRTDKEVQEVFRQAINRGVDSINELLEQHLKSDAKPFLISQVPQPLEIFDFMSQARADWISARDGKHVPDKQLIFKAYSAIRNWGLGYYVLMIDESPEVISSLRNYNLALEWFQSTFGFRNPKEAGVEGFSQSWETDTGVRVYGTDLPIRARLKVLDPARKIPRYSSILTKMLNKGHFPDSIEDYSGVEFIVEDKPAQERLIHFFSANLKGTARLEKFKRTGSSGSHDNQYSSSGFECVKFMIRPPVPTSAVSYGAHPGYERIPIEVQVLTLEADKTRRENPDVRHAEYKRKQFMSAFPVLFPRQIYAPVIRTQH